jgi:hypothetical protein
MGFRAEALGIDLSASKRLVIELSAKTTSA